MVYGYARISRPQQSIERQMRNIEKEYPDAHILKEAFTGTRMDRGSHPGEDPEGREVW